MILGNASSLQPNQYQEKLTGKHGSPAEAYLKLISNWISLKAFTGILNSQRISTDPSIRFWVAMRRKNKTSTQKY